MAIREQLEQHKGLASGAAALGMVIVAALAWRSLGGPVAPTSTVSLATYTTDDGKTYFTATDDHLAPFDQDGRQAVRAVLFTCDGGKSKFIGYLTRIKPAAKLEIDKRRQSGNLNGLAEIVQQNTEIKAPGTGDWQPMNSPAGSRLRNIKPPTGQTGEPHIAGL